MTREAGSRAAGLRLLGRVALSALLIWLIAWRLDWKALWVIFSGASGRLLAIAAVISPITILMLALRLKLLLSDKKIRLPLSAIVRLTWAGQFFNAFLPGATGGDAFKLYEIGRLAPASRTDGAAVIVVDRLLALAALLFIAIASFAFEPAPILALLHHGLRIGRAVFILPLGLAIAGAAFQILRARFPAVDRLLDSASRAVGAVIRAAAKTLRWSKATVGAGLLALATHLTSFTVVFILARALRIQITYWQVVEMMPVVLLIIMLPITINGHGLREMLMIGYFKLLGIGGGGAPSSTGQIAVALSLAFVANDLVCALPGGALYFLFPPSPPVSSSLPNNEPTSE